MAKNRRQNKKSPFEKETNKYITVNFDEVRLVDCEDESKNGVMDSRIALRYARDADLDLVLMNTKAKPVICKIMDYKKYLYTMSKESKDKSKSSKIQTKQIQLGLDISPNDIDYRINNAVKWLEKKNRVKITLLIKGYRNMKRSEDGAAVIKDFVKQINEREVNWVASFDAEPKLAGRNWSAVVSQKPKSSKKKSNDSNDSNDSKDSQKPKPKKNKNNGDNNKTS